jgi:hypothetical protein
VARRPLRTGTICIAVTLALVVSQFSGGTAHALATSSAAVPLRTTLATPADVARFAPAGIDTTQAANAYAPTDPVTVTSTLSNVSPVDSSPLVSRSIYPTAGALYVADLYVSPDGRHSAASFYSVPRAGGGPTILAGSVADITPDGMVATAKQGTVTSTLTGAAPAVDCSGCILAGGAAGVLLSLVCIGGGTFVYFLCSLSSAVFGTGISQACVASSCIEHIPGVAYLRGTCQFATCDLTADVHTPQGWVLNDLGTGVDWSYAPGDYATLDSGGNASEYVEGFDYFSPQPTAYEATSALYQWSVTSGEPRWANCTTSVQISVTARWTNYQFSTTGWLPPQGKLFLTGCPGEHL